MDTEQFNSTLLSALHDTGLTAEARIVAPGYTRITISHPEHPEFIRMVETHQSGTAKYWLRGFRAVTNYRNLDESVIQKLVARVKHDFSAYFRDHIHSEMQKWKGDVRKLLPP